MRYLCVGDPHLKISTMEVAKKFLDFLQLTEASEKPDGVIVMGDLFDTHSVMRVEILNLWINYLKQAKTPHILIKGNHDETAPGSNIHALVALEAYATVIDEPQVWNGLGFIQYLHTEGEFKMAVDSIADQTDVLFCHQTFQGAQYENGFYDPNGFATDCLKGFQMVISGHIHKFQTLENIVYVGSPYAANFGDAGQDKYVFIYDAQLKKLVKAIPVPLPKYTVKTFESAGDVLSTTMDSNLDSYRFVVKDTKIAIAALVDSKAFKDLKKKYRITFVPEYTDMIAKTIRISEKSSLQEMLETYVGSMMKTDLDKTKLISMAKEALEKAGLEASPVK